MARRSKQEQPEDIRTQLIDLLTHFKIKLIENDLREQVRALIPANYLLRDLGSSLLIDEDLNSASERILAYLRRFPQQMISGDELMVIAGISEYARRIRELRVEMGWPIMSTAMLKIAFNDDPEALLPIGISTMPELKADHYVLIQDQQDREAAYRWKLANGIRKSDLSVRDKLLEFLRKNTGKAVTGEELQYLAKNNTEWARRIRELRTEFGWPVVTRNTGNPDLPVGVYMLEEDRQAPEHDRKIPDAVRARVLERDHFKCCMCHWEHDKKNPSDPRSFLELHHIKHHVKGGENSEANLITLCNVCHDDVHRKHTPPETLEKRLAHG